VPRTDTHLDLTGEDPSASSGGLLLRTSPFSEPRVQGRRVAQESKALPPAIEDDDEEARTRGVERALCYCIGALTCLASCEGEDLQCPMENETGACSCAEWQTAIANCEGCLGRRAQPGVQVDG
jgi:hypothetical protein